MHYNTACSLRGMVGEVNVTTSYSDGVQNSAVIIMPCYRLFGPGFKKQSVQKNFFLHTCPDKPWGPTILLYNRYWISVPGVKWLGSGTDDEGHSGSRSPREADFSRKDGKLRPCTALFSSMTVQESNLGIQGDCGTGREHNKAAP